MELKRVPEKRLNVANAASARKIALTPVKVTSIILLDTKGVCRKSVVME